MLTVLNLCCTQFMLTVWRRVFTPFQVAQLTVQTYPHNADILAMIKYAAPSPPSYSPEAHIGAHISLALLRLRDSMPECLMAFPEVPKAVPGQSRDMSVRLCRTSVCFSPGSGPLILLLVALLCASSCLLLDAMIAARWRRTWASRRPQRWCARAAS
jgi:hypothetical protein